jgi:hypothetical protein
MPSRSALQFHDKGYVCFLQQQERGGNKTALNPVWNSGHFDSLAKSIFT